MLDKMSSTFSVSLVLLLLAALGYCQIEICGHDQFDISTLKRQPFWTFRVNDPKWCVGGEANEQTAECHASFSICGPLPNGPCNVNNNGTGFCQTVKDGSIETSYDTGKATIIIEEQAGTDGFQIAYRNGTNTSSCVNATTTTLVFFQCDQNAQWNAYDNNVTRFVDSFLVDPLDACLFILTLNYSGACISQKPIFPNLCQLGEYDIGTLSQPTGWVAQMNSSKCYGLSVPGSTCEMVFSFCKELPSGLCYKSSFCQQASHPYSFGEFNKDMKIYENDDQMGFTMTYTNGTKTTACPAGLFSTLVFTCDPNAQWTADPNVAFTNITQFITSAEPSFNNPNLQDCEYIVRFNYSGACVDITVNPTTLSGGSKQSPVGWILMGIFFGVVIIYLAVGVVIQGVRGKRGVELVPNHDFWRAVIVYILEGCQLTMDFVTCHSLRNKGVSSISKKTDYESL